MLDNSVALFINEFGDGNAHDSDNIPITSPVELAERLPRVDTSAFLPVRFQGKGGRPGICFYPSSVPSASNAQPSAPGGRSR